MLLVTWWSLIGCGGGYDLDSWRSPLASGFDGEADAAEGERLYYEEHWLDDSAYGFTCVSCHHDDGGDTLTVDADELNRSAHSVWNAAWRESWKGGQGWDLEESNSLGAYGGQICVTAYFPSGSAMTAEEAAHLEAYIRTRKDEAPEVGDPLAAPLEYGFTSWDTQEAFLASVADGDGWLYGSELGDPSAGAGLAARYCGACHAPEGSTEPVFSTASKLDLGTLIQRVRRVKLDDETPAPNERMPRLPEDKLSDEDLRLVLAWVTMGREGG